MRLIVCFFHSLLQQWSELCKADESSLVIRRNDEAKVTDKRQFYDNMFQNPIIIIDVYKYTINVLGWRKVLIIAGWCFFAVVIYASHCLLRR